MEHEGGMISARAMEQRGSKRPIFLECIQKTGMRTAFAYSYMTELRFNPNVPELRVFFGETEVVVQGRNLQLTYEGLRQCRLTQIEEKALNEDDGDEESAFVDSITILSKR